MRKTRRDRQPGTYVLDDGALRIVWLAPEKREGTRSITIPYECVDNNPYMTAIRADVKRGEWNVLETPQEEVVPEEAGTPQRRRVDVAIEVVAALPGRKGGPICGELLYRMGEDDEDQSLRAKTLGALNDWAERGLIFRDYEDRFWPIDSEEAKTRPSWGEGQQENIS